MPSLSRVPRQFFACQTIAQLTPDACPHSQIFEDLKSMLLAVLSASAAQLKSDILYDGLRPHHNTGAATEDPLLFRHRFQHHDVDTGRLLYYQYEARRSSRVTMVDDIGIISCVASDAGELHYCRACSCRRKSRWWHRFVRHPGRHGPDLQLGRGSEAARTRRQLCCRHGTPSSHGS